MNILADLFLTFAKVGCFTFGGGYAMIALIEDACVEQKKWITHDDMMNVTVIAESTPGPIAINCATYVGYRQAGFAGAAAATIGMVLPSFLIIFAISRFLDNFLEIGWVASAFQGIKIAVGILIVDAGLTMLKKMKKKPFPRIVAASAFVILLAADLLAVHLSSIALMVVAAIAGLAYSAAKGPGQGKPGQQGPGKPGTDATGRPNINGADKPGPNGPDQSNINGPGKPGTDKESGVAK